MFYTLTANPAVDMTVSSSPLEPDENVRTGSASYTANGKGLDVSLSLIHISSAFSASSSHSALVHWLMVLRARRIDGALIENSSRPQPVSYTHLDVYKRQLLHSASLTVLKKVAAAPRARSLVSPAMEASVCSTESTIISTTSTACLLYTSRCV